MRAGLQRRPILPDQSRRISARCVMASIRKLATGNYRAEVARRGVRKSKVFPSKSAAKEWAARQEYLILNAEEVASGGTFGEMLDRYAREVSTGKRGARWEIVRIEKLRKDRIAQKRLSDLKPADFADWRDRRGREVAPASVVREMQLIPSALNVARKEWGLIKANPCAVPRAPPRATGWRRTTRWRGWRTPPVTI